MKTYFARPIGRETPIKIGRSDSPWGRVYMDVRWGKERCELIAVLEGDFEHRLHAKFADWHEGREWFTSNDELLAVIDAVTAGTFDTSDLPAPRELGGGRYHKAKIGKFAKIGIAA
jgi:hypothetical protein